MCIHLLCTLEISIILLSSITTMDATNQSSTKVTPNDEQLNADCQTLPTTTGNAVPAQPTTNSDPRLNFAKKNPNTNNQTIDMICPIPNTKRYNSINEIYSDLPTKKMKECREEFLGHQPTTTKVTVATLPQLPPMNRTSLEQIATSGDAMGMPPFEKMIIILAPQKIVIAPSLV